MVKYSLPLTQLSKELTELFEERELFWKAEDGALQAETVSGRKLTLSPEGDLLTLEQTDGGYHFLMEVVSIAEACGATQVTVTAPIREQTVGLTTFKRAALARHLAYEQLDRFERFIDREYSDALGPITVPETSKAAPRRRRESA